MAPSKTIAEPEDYNVGTYIAYRIEELGVRDFFVVPGASTLKMFSQCI
jgi:pyruvate decarboxylase